LSLFDSFLRYVEMLENRVWILEAGLKEALFHLNGTVEFRQPPLPSNPHCTNFVEGSHNLTYNITDALKELDAMKFEREEGMYQGHDSHDDNNHADSPSTIYNADSTPNMEIEHLTTSPDVSEPRCPADSDHHFLLTPGDCAGDCAVSSTVPDVLTARITGTGDALLCEKPSVSWLSLLVTDEIYFSHSETIAFGP
jgi:hypothetical protein